MFVTGQAKIEKIAARFEGMVKEIELGVQECCTEQSNNSKEIERLSDKNKTLSASMEKGNRIIRRLLEITA